MNFPDGLVPYFWAVSAWFLYVPLLLLAVHRAPWRRLAQGESLHVLLGTTVAVMLMWGMKAGLAAGLNLHLLGATLLVLMFGWPLALLASAAIVLGVTVNGEAGWYSLALNGLLLGAVPVLVSQSVYYLVDRYLPNHFFVYIFLCAFFGAAFSMGVVGLISALFLSGMGVYAFDYVTYNFLRYLPLLMFPEAFITGMLTTLFVVYFPQWVSSFDDARYLRNH